MKYVLIALLFVFSNKSNNPTYIENEIKLEDYYKVKSTFSGEINDLNSFHFITAKNRNTKTFDIIPSVFNFKKQKFKQFKAISFDKQPSIVSFHYNKDIISLIASIKVGREEFLRVVDINTLSGEVEISKDISKRDMKTSLRRKNNTLLIYALKEGLKIVNIKNSNSIKSINVKTTQVTNSIFESIFETNIDPIRYDEFVQNGSISYNKVYATDDEVIITRDITEKNQTKVVQIPLNTGIEVQASVKKLDNNKKGLTKKLASYVINNKLYQFKTSKDRGEILVFNLVNAENSEIELTESSISDKARKFKSLEKFFNQASRGSIEPTISLNRTKSNNLLVRLDYVSFSGYNFQDDWIFRWQNDLYRNQPLPLPFNNDIPSVRFGGPSPDYYDYIAFNEPQIAQEGNHFEIMIDSNDNVLIDVDDELIYKNINIEKYKREIINNQKYKYHSAVVIGNQFRFFVYHKRSKSFRVFKKELDD